MLTGVDVLTGQGAMLSLLIEDVVNGFVVEDIDGLDPVKATIVSSSFATQDGEQYQSARREKRNIVLKLGLEPDYSTGSVSKLRKQLYAFFMPKSSLTLTFHSDDLPDVNIAGRVESFDAPLFTDDPQATISILNFNPDFEDPTNHHLTGLSVADLSINPITYGGTVETGFVFKFQVDRALTEFSIINTGSDGVQRNMDFTIPTGLAAGDVLTVNTISGSKGVTLTRAGADSSLLYALSPYSDWLQLYPGLNNFRVSATGAGIPYTIDYTDKYGGL